MNEFEEANKYTGILKALSEAPSTQIDSAITMKLAALADTVDVKASQMHDILDECAHASLASDFAMMAMDTVWNQMLADEGDTKEEAIRRKHG